jgi:glycogen debranching enzyme
MADAVVRGNAWSAWSGPSLLIVDGRGECGAPGLTGYYYREARFLRTLRLEVNGTAPCLCEAASVDRRALAFTFNHPELTDLGGGGSGQSGDAETRDEHGIPHRALALRAEYRLTAAGLRVSMRIANHALAPVACELAWIVDGDFADIQEVNGGKRQQQAPIETVVDADAVTFSYAHAELPYRTRITPEAAPGWTFERSRISTTVRLAPRESRDLSIGITPIDPRDPLTAAEAAARERHRDHWRSRFTRLTAPGAADAQQIVQANVEDVAAFAHLEGSADEWLALQAGMPLYPAFFGRDSLTAGWQAAYLDRGQSLEATLTRLGRLQSARTDDWHEEEPGRIPYQVRNGPLARLRLNPYAAYYADFASPLMFVISLAHLYAWTGSRAELEKHWDVARRILDWARTRGDRDGDGYLEYQTRSSDGTKNQGWKDSGDAVIDDEGRPVPAPIATCELQGYWFAAQQAMAVLSAVMTSLEEARSWWREAGALKERFNRDWWVPDEHCVAFALDPGKQQVRAVTSNAGHCLASGIVDALHLPALVGRLFAPDVFSGWGIRTLSANHAFYNPLSYHRGTVWAVEQATIAFGLRRFGFDARAADLSAALFDLARLYAGYRVPECVGGYARGEYATPGAYPRANPAQLWNATAFPLLVHTLLGLQPVAPLELLVIDPALPEWLPEVVLHDLRIAGATVTLRCWRDRHGASHGELVHKRGTLRLLRQPPPESLTAGVRDRAAALLDSLVH